MLTFTGFNMGVSDVKNGTDVRRENLKYNDLTTEKLGDFIQNNTEIVQEKMPPIFNGD